MSKEHIKMVEDYIGRKLGRYELVHHINDRHYDNRLENFYVFQSSKKHGRWHAVLRDGTVEPEVLKSNLEALKRNNAPFASNGAIRSELVKRREVRKELEQKLENEGLLEGLADNERYVFVTAKLKEAIGKPVLWKEDIYKPN